MSLLAELRRRNVIRMAGLYLVGAWLVVQVAATLLPVFAAPEWVMRVLVGLLAAGFIAALVFSWVFELTPGGFKRDDEVPASESIAPQTARRMDRMIIVVLALALGYFAIDKFVLAPARHASSEPAEAAAREATTTSPNDAAAAGDAVANDATAVTANAIDPKSIAVLAFADLSQAQDQAYFSDGVAEEILNALAKVDELRVAGRTSSFYFKGRNEPLAAIGSTLGVAHVLEGSVRKQGERLRISAKLLRVGDGVELWADTFDGTDADIFGLQENIAQQVTSQLKVALNADQGAGLVDTGTTNPVAYALYLRASDVFTRRASSEFLNAIKLLEEAVALDPSFARAWSKLGALHAITPDYLNIPNRVAEEAATASARRALALQSNLAEPHAVLGQVHAQDMRFAAARAAYEQALAIDANDLTANLWYALELGNTGYQRAKAARLEHVLELDPLLPNALNHYGDVLMIRGDLDGARKALERAKELGAPNGDIFLWSVSLAQGRRNEARAELERAIRTFGANLPPTAVPVIAAGIIDEGEPRARALALVRGLVAQPAYSDSGMLAQALIRLGAPDEALAMMARQPMNSSNGLNMVWRLGGEAARTSPAFAEFARKVGYAALWDQYGPPDLCRKDANGDYRCE
jgi:TolB-like protein/Flp pilus assembly protein TadD